METLFAILLEAVVEIVFELGLEALRRAFRRQRRAHPVFSAIGFVVLGSTLGALSGWYWPMPILPASPQPGVNVIVAPLLVGLVMQEYGAWSARRGREPSYLATFWGGALFAFALAGTRRLVIAGF